MALDQGTVTGVGEGAGRGWHGHTRSPGTFKLSMAGCGGGVVWGRWGR